MRTHSIVRSVTALLLLTATVTFGQSVPYTPASDDVVLEHVSPFQRPTRAAVQDLPQAVAFARGAIKEGNSEGDPRFFGYAQSALRPWWDQPQPPTEVRQLRATILQWLHQFDAAKADLDAIIMADGAGVMQAHLTRATVELVQGDAVAARRDCAALIGHVETLIAATCIASANSQLGRLPDTQQALRTAFDATPGASPEARRWALTELADMAQRRKQPEEALAAYQAAMGQIAPGEQDPYLLAAYADFLLDQHRPREVVTLLSGLSRIDNLLLRLALAENALAQQDPATWLAVAQGHTEDLARRFAETRQRGDGIHQREEALYLLKLRHQPEAALAVASDNWTRQRELIDARVLVECAAAAGRPVAAAPVHEWVTRTGVEDARL